jgi:hypothetical protein
MPADKVKYSLELILWTDDRGHTTQEAANEVAKGQDGNMYDLSLMNELGARTIIVMLPESFGLQDIREKRVDSSRYLTLLPILLIKMWD